jgi:unsaturated chondroitin disaccharide hydrolase
MRVPRPRTPAVAALSSLVLLVAPVGAASRVKVVKLSVTNPSDDARPLEPIVLKVADLKAVAPDFSPSSFVVTATDATSVEQDARLAVAAEQPSQADDVDGDGDADEIAFQIALAPKQTRLVTIAYGDYDTLLRLRAPYPARTAAAYAQKYEGLGWESELLAWRVYFDARNAVDLFGKRRPGLQLALYASPDYDYHRESPYGRDVYKNGDALGIGSVVLWHDGAVQHPNHVLDRRWHVLATGPVRSIVAFEYMGWAVGDKKVDVRTRITQWAGERGFDQRVNVGGDPVATVATGLPIKPGLSPIRERHGDVGVLATWGAQVVEPGATGTASLPGQNLGLAVLVAGGEAGGVPERDGLNHLAPVPLHDGDGRWYVMAAWDQEGTERIEGWGAREGYNTSIALSPTGLTSAAAFRAAVGIQARAMASPAVTTVLSTQAAPQTAPLGTLHPARAKTYSEALDLVRQEAERTATKFLPELQREGNELSKEQGSGFFSEADNETGEWKAQKGYFWTGGFWVGTLWRLHEQTGDDRFRQWAEAWNAKLLGREHLQNHDAGFINYYSSVLGYERTKDDKYRQGAVRAAERLKKLYNPQVELISAWGEKGNDTIIDTMMNIQLWWWLSKQSGDPSWRELAKKHANRTLEWFFRPDGSTYQSVHYNPGDNPQTFDGSSVLNVYPNTAKPGELIFRHTHQGRGADTCWSRGAAWAVYGFARAYQETKDKTYLDASRKTAAYMLDHLPEDDVPWYDFQDEGVFVRNKDTSAAAILAEGLLILGDVVPERAAAAEYHKQGARIVQSLIDRYLTPVGAGDKTPPGLLRHGCSTRPRDFGLVYGQYYLLEALMHLTNGKKN